MAEIRQESPFPGHVNLRGDPRDAVFLNAVEEVLGFGLPIEPNTVVDGDDVIAFWLGPDEWLLTLLPERTAEVVTSLREGLKKTLAAVTEVSGGYTVIRLGGERVRDLLAKGCTLDLHPRTFGPGRCAQTLLVKAPVLIRQLDESPVFEITVRRSFADYLWRWLVNA